MPHFLPNYFITLKLRYFRYAAVLSAVCVSMSEERRDNTCKQALAGLAAAADAIDERTHFSLCIIYGI